MGIKLTNFFNIIYCYEKRNYYIELLCNFSNEKINVLT